MRQASEPNGSLRGAKGLCCGGRARCGSVVRFIANHVECECLRSSPACASERPMGGKTHASVQATIVEPLQSPAVASLQEPGGAGEIEGRSAKWTFGGEDVTLGGRLKLVELGGKLACCQQCDGMERARNRAVRGALEPLRRGCRQNDEPACPACGGHANGCIAGYGSVAQESAIDLNWCKGRRNCAAREDGSRGRSTREHHGLSREDVRCNDVHGESGVLKMV
jgi:hypothetical protein